MLVLTRKLDEEILIDGKIIVKVIELNGKWVKLGVLASQDVQICRIDNGMPVSRKGRAPVTAKDFRTRNYITGEPVDLS